MTSDEALEVAEFLGGILMFSIADNITVSTVVQIIEKFPGIIYEEECVAQNVFVSVDKLLETEKEILEESERGNNSTTR